MSAKSSLTWFDTSTPTRGKTHAVVGARVSTATQDERDTPEVQLARVRRYAQEHGYHIVGELREVISGATILARKHLREVFEAARVGRVQVLVLDKNDRTGRGKAQTILEYEADKAGLRIEYATAGPDISTPAGAIVHSVQTAISEVERQQITERFTKGKYERSRRGQIVLPSRIPFGYRAVRTFDNLGRRVSSALEVDEAKIAIYHRARRMLVSESITLRQICKQFNAEGIPSPTGSKWGTQSLRIILSNRIYAGEYRYGVRVKKRIDTEEGVKQIQTGTRTDYVSVQVPAVITEAEYADIVATIEDNKRRFERPKKYQYLLSGMIKCAQCGRSYNGCPTSDNGRVYLRYRCRGNTAEGRKCDATDVAAPTLEQTAWAIVKQFIIDPSVIEDSAGERRRRQADAGAIEAEIAAQQKEIDAASAEMTNAIALQARVGSLSADAAEAFVATMAQIQRRINTARAIMGSIEQRRDAIKAMRESEIEANRIREELAAQIGDDMPFEAVQHILRRVRLMCVWDSAKRVLTLSSLVGSSSAHIPKR